MPGLLQSEEPLIVKLNFEKKELIILNLEECAKLYNNWTHEVNNRPKSNSPNAIRDKLIKALTKDKEVKLGSKCSTTNESGEKTTSQAFIINDANIWKKLACTKQVRIQEFKSVIVKVVTVKYNFWERHGCRLQRCHFFSAWHFKF